MEDSTYQQIIKKKEFSEIPRADVERAYARFDRHFEEDRIKKTRDLLRKTFSGFGGKKLLVWKDKCAEEVLKKHLSTRERFEFYSEIYSRLLKNLPKQISIIDLGCGVNGFSYCFLEKALTNSKKLHSQARDIDLIINNKIRAKDEQGKLLEKDKNKMIINYLGIEAVGQLVKLQNDFFKANKIKKAKVVHESLFEVEKIKKLISATKKSRVVFMFKVVDALESLERNFTKTFLQEIMSLVEKCVISFPTESWMKRKKFFVQRTWLIDFIKEQGWNFTDDFVLGGERYVVIEKK